jgi:pSer/pThr/pTyr-binding forkhead associated (FHA) protein
MPRLDFYVNYELQATFTLTGEEITIGRDSSSTVLIPDGRVSRTHSIIRAIGDRHEIENRGANGTKVNGVQIGAPQTLAPEDAIFISHYILIYQSDEIPPAEDAGTVLDR